MSLFTRRFLHRERQTKDVLDGIQWRGKASYNGRPALPPVQTVGIISGINGWRCIDIDAQADADATKQPVPEGVARAVLGALGLADSYPWYGRSRSGAGWHIWLRCVDELPAELAQAAIRKGESGVKVGQPRAEYAGQFDHVELRWERCQTVLPCPTGYGDALPTEPPALVTGQQVAAAFLVIATPKQPDAPTRPTPARRADAPHTGQASTGVSVIGAFNARYDVVDILSRNGYRERGGCWQHPNASAPDAYGVNILDGRAYTHHATDPLRNGHSHDAFSAFTVLEHGNDEIAAVKAAAAALGIAPHTTNSPAPNGQPQAQAADSLPEPRRPRSASATEFGQIMQDLHAGGFTFRLNRLTDTIDVNGEPINDIIAAHIRVHMRGLGYRGMDAIQDAYTVDADKHSYHPVCEYLDNLHWDGVDRLADLAACLNSTDGLVQYADGSAAPLAAVYLRRWLVGAVARAHTETQNAMLVLSGPQGSGKSTFVAWLGSVLRRNFLEAPIQPDDKDSTTRLMDTFIWEVAELGGTTRRADVQALKAFLTRQRVNIRLPYARYAIDKPALASFVGTVNPDSGFLMDTTGNRRFNVLSCGVIDWRYTDLDIHQVWAQAVALYQAGEPWRLLPEEAAARDTHNQTHEADTLLDGWLYAHFDIGPGQGATAADFLSTAEIVSHLQAADVTLRQTPQTTSELKRVIERAGGAAHRKTHVRGYRYIRARPLTERRAAAHDTDPPPPPSPPPSTNGQAQGERHVSGTTSNTPIPDEAGSGAPRHTHTAPPDAEHDTALLRHVTDATEQAALRVTLAETRRIWASDGPNDARAYLSAHAPASITKESRGAWYVQERKARNARGQRGRAAPSPNGTQPVDRGAP